MDLTTPNTSPLSALSWPSAFLLSAITFVVSVAIYRLFFCPAARFPGPILAALTFAYEAYFDIFKEGGGRYWVEINRMHDALGK
jgi:hypothetical protein